MENIKSLLTNTLNPQARLMQETRNLVTKWDKTGLLEGIKSDIEKSNMAVLLENQAKQLIEEATATGTSANSEQWAGVALPLVRRVFAEFAAKEFVSVQPMNLPSGLVFYLDFKYGTNQMGRAGDSATSYASLFGGTGIKSGSTDKPIGGLYGAGKYGYTINDKISTGLTATIATATQEDINWLTNYYVQASKSGSIDVLQNSISASWAKGELLTVTTTGLKAASTAAGNVIDANAVRSFVIDTAATTASASFVNYYPAFTKLTSTGEVQFVVSASSGYAISASIPEAKVVYSVQPTDSNRGDFEDNSGNTTAFVSPTGKSTTDTGLNKDIGIPEVNLELKSEPIVAKTRKLKAVWTPELAQDLNAYHSIDAEAELTALLSEYVSMEIDLEILDMLITNVPALTTERWSAKLNTEIVPNGTGGYNVVTQTVAGTGGYYTKEIGRAHV